MNSLDRMMKAKRKRRYKHLRKLFKARDKAGKYTKQIITVSRLDQFFDEWTIKTNFVSSLAFLVIEKERRVLGFRPKPPIPFKTKIK